MAKYALSIFETNDEICCEHHIGLALDMMPGIIPVKIDDSAVCRLCAESAPETIAPDARKEQESSAKKFRTRTENLETTYWGGHATFIHVGRKFDMIALFHDMDPLPMDIYSQVKGSVTMVFDAPLMLPERCESALRCWDCEKNPCICASIFPFSRERTPDGKVYDHLGELLHDPRADTEASVSARYCRQCGVRFREHGCELCDGCALAPVPHWHVYRDIGGACLPDDISSYDTLEYARDDVRNWTQDMADCYSRELDETEALASQPDYEYDRSDYRMYVNEEETYADITGGSGFVRRCYVERCDDSSCESYGSDW